MKKTILFAVALVLSVSFVAAQPRAVGLRLGDNAELSLEQMIGSKMLQIDAGLTGLASNDGTGVGGVITYNVYSSSFGNNSAGVWGTFAGIGVGAGYDWEHTWRLKNIDDFTSVYPHVGFEQDKNDKYLVSGTCGYYGVALNFGMEYEFSALPLMISLDYRPLIGFDLGRDNYPGVEKMHMNFHKRGLWDAALVIRYVF